ncbi:MAG: hypothetical protein ACLQJR_29525 [Stellaceae bacterium]
MAMVNALSANPLPPVAGAAESSDMWQARPAAVNPFFVVAAVGRAGA